MINISLMFCSDFFDAVNWKALVNDFSEYVTILFTLVEPRIQFKHCLTIELKIICHAIIDSIALNSYFCYFLTRFIVSAWKMAETD